MQVWIMIVSELVKEYSVIILRKKKKENDDNWVFYVPFNIFKSHRDDGSHWWCVIMKGSVQWSVINMSIILSSGGFKPGTSWSEVESTNQ